MKKWIIKSLFLGLFLIIEAATTWAVIPVRVALDPFPPYVEKDKNGHWSGVNVDMMKIMNRFQSKYKFIGVSTSSKNRFELFTMNRYDMYMSVELIWGWEGYPVDSTGVYLHGGEKYVALAKSGRGQEYFDEFKGKRLAGYLGYHYGLANFNSDPDLLKKKYNMQLSATHEGNLLKVVHQRADIAIVTEAYISRWLILHPEHQEKLLISDKWDQKYNLVMIIRKGISPTVKELDELITKMGIAGVLVPLWKKYGLH